MIASFLSKQCQFNPFLMDFCFFVTCHAWPDNLKPAFKKNVKRNYISIHVPFSTKPPLHFNIFFSSNHSKTYFHWLGAHRLALAHILQPTLCVILFRAFESTIIFEETAFYGLCSQPRALDRFLSGHCFGLLSSNSLYHCKWRRTRLKLYNQSEKRTSFVQYVNFFGVVYENSVMTVSTVVVISFSSILLKLVVREKKFTCSSFCVLLSTSACITLVVLLKNTIEAGLKQWRCGNFFYLKLGLCIVWVCQTPDQARWRILKNRKQLSSKCSKSTTTKAKHTGLRNIQLICLFCQVFG